MSKPAPRHCPRITDVFRRVAPSALWLLKVERSVLCSDNAVDHNAAQRPSGVCQMVELPEIAYKNGSWPFLVAIFSHGVANQHDGLGRQGNHGHTFAASHGPLQARTSS